MGIANLQGRWSLAVEMLEFLGQNQAWYCRRFCIELADISNLALWLDAAKCATTISRIFGWYLNGMIRAGAMRLHNQSEEPTTGVANINGKNVLSWKVLPR